MPLALHLVAGQSQHYDLRRVLANLSSARDTGPDSDFYEFLHQQCWDELSIAARGLLAFMAVATRTAQTSLQLLDITPTETIHFDAELLENTLGELARWFLVERAESEQPGESITYGLHDLTRKFVLSARIRTQWARVFPETRLREEAAAKHFEILRRALQ